MSGYGNGGRDEDGGWDRYCEEMERANAPRRDQCDCGGTGIRYVDAEEPGERKSVPAFCVCKEGDRLRRGDADLEMYEPDNGF